MKRLAALLFSLLFAGLVASGQNVKTWNGGTVGSSTGNIYKWNGEVFHEWNGLTVSSGAGTASAVSTQSCYPFGSTPWTCTPPASPGVQAGDLIIAFAGVNNPAPTISWTGCSSSASSSSYSADGNNDVAVGSWCIAASTTLPVATAGGGCLDNDCGMVLFQARSTTGWNTSSFTIGSVQLTFTGGVASGAAITATAANNLVLAYALDESVGTYTVGTGWTLGGGSPAHTDYSEYELNVGAGSITPTYSSSNNNSPLGITVAVGVN